MKQKNTKGRILANFYDLVAEYGYDNASISMLADRVGIKKASLYYYFSSKEELFVELVKMLYQNHLNELREELPQINTSQEYRNCLTQMGDHLIGHWILQPKLQKFHAEVDLQTNRIGALKTCVRHFNREARRILQEFLQRGRDLSVFPSHADAEGTASLLYALLLGIDRALLHQLPLHPMHLWEQTLELIFSSNPSYRG